MSDFSDELLNTEGDAGVTDYPEGENGLYEHFRFLADENIETIRLIMALNPVNW